MLLLAGRGSRPWTELVMGIVSAFSEGDAEPSTQGLLGLPLVHVETQSKK